MNRQEFIETTVSELKPELFEKLKETLIDKYISVSFLESGDITYPVLKELINEYFKKVGLSTDKTFYKIIDKYASDLDSVIDDKVDTISKGNKERSPREHRYYGKAKQLKKKGITTMEKLQDYSRIMLCLYAAIINSREKTGNGFDYTLNCLNLEKILEELDKEEINIIVGKKKAFNIKEAYRADRSTFIVLIIMYYYIMNNNVEAE